MSFGYTYMLITDYHPVALPKKTIIYIWFSQPNLPIQPLTFMYSLI